jgi:HEAT repeat protein
MLESLARQLKSKDPILPRNAAAKLGNSGEKSAVSFLVRELADENRNVHQATLEL